MFSKSLIQFSVEGWSCVPSLLFIWGQTMVEVMKTMVTSSKRPMHILLHPVLPTLQQASTDPCLHCRLLDTHGLVWVSLLRGYCSFLLDLGAHQVLFVPSQSLFSQPCVSSGRVNGDLLQEGLCQTQVCCTQRPVPAAGHS